MKKPAMPAPVQLPYASTAASYFADQGGVGGNSFLGRFFAGMSGRPSITQRNPSTVPARKVGAEMGAIGNLSSNNSADR